MYEQAPSTDWSAQLRALPGGAPCSSSALQPMADATSAGTTPQEDATAWGAALVAAVLAYLFLG